MLQRHIEILHGLWFFSEHIEKPIADVGWIRVHDAHPFDAVGVRQFAQQVREGVLLAEVFAVARRILGHQNQLLHTFFRKLMCLGYYRAEAATAKMSAHLGNETESAGTVTAFSDLDKGIVAGSRQHARRRFIVEISCALIAQRNDGQRSGVRVWIANGEDVVDLTGADESIHLGHFRFQLITITLNQAPGNDQARRRTSGLEPRRFQNRFDRFLFC